MTRTILNSKGLGLSFWGEAINIANHILNIVILKTDTYQAPYGL